MLESREEAAHYDLGVTLISKACLVHTVHRSYDQADTYSSFALLA